MPGSRRRSRSCSASRPATTWSCHSRTATAQHAASTFDLVVQQPLRAVGRNDLEAVGGETARSAGRALAARVVCDAERRALPGAKDDRLLSEPRGAIDAHVDQSCAAVE